MDHKQKNAEEYLAPFRDEMDQLLKKLKLPEIVTVDDIEKELKRIRNITDSALLLGCIRRGMEIDPNGSSISDSAALWLKWKNALCRDELYEWSQFIKNFSISIFSENSPRRIREELIWLDSLYVKHTKAILTLHTLSNEECLKMAQLISAEFEMIEPYMKCTSEAFRFYGNFASLALHCGKSSQALKFLELSAELNPTHPIAQKVDALQKLVDENKRYGRNI